MPVADSSKCSRAAAGGSALSMHSARHGAVMALDMQRRVPSCMAKHGGMAPVMGSVMPHCWPSWRRCSNLIAAAQPTPCSSAAAIQQCRAGHELSPAPLPFWWGQAHSTFRSCNDSHIKHRTTQVHQLQTWRGYQAPALHSRPSAVSVTVSASTLPMAQPRSFTQMPFQQYNNKATILQGRVIAQTYTSDNGYKVLQIEVDQTCWSSDVEAIISAGAAAAEQAKDRKAHSGWGMASPPKGSRKLSVSGKELRFAEVGQRFRFKGRWRLTRYGAQLEIDHLQSLQPESEADIAAQLQGLGKGMGPHTAASLVSHFKGKRVLEVLGLPEKAAIKQLQSVPGIGPKKAWKIKKLYDEQAARQNVAHRLQELGIRADACASVAKHLAIKTGTTVTAASAEEALRQDPWGALLGATGVSFADAERVAKTLGVPCGNQLSRAKLAMMQTLWDSLNKSCACVEWCKVRSEANKLLDNKLRSKLTNDEPLRRLALELQVDRHLIIDVDVASPSVFGPAQPWSMAPAASAASTSLPLDWPDQTRCYLEAMYRAERDLAASVADKTLAAVAAGVWKLEPKSQPLAPPPPPPQPPGSAGKSARNQVASAGADATSADAGTGDAPVMSDTDGALSADSLPFAPSSGLTPLQRSAVELAQHAPIMLLTGSAGCGKTLTAREIIQQWLRAGKEVAVCAPTGRAAQRLQQLVSHPDIHAQTVHRLLGYKGSGDDQHAGSPSDSQQQPGTGTGLTQSDDGAAGDELPAVEMVHWAMAKYNKNSPLPMDAVLLDEASMLDLQMAAAIMAALRPDAQLVLVGDPNQLAPVGAGHVLTALLALRCRQVQQAAAAAETEPQAPAKAEPSATASPTASSEHKTSAPAAEMVAPDAMSPPAVVYAPKPARHAHARAAATSATASAAFTTSTIAAEPPDCALVPRMHLDEVFRQASGGAIVAGALQIIRSQRPIAMKPVAPQQLFDMLSAVSLSTYGAASDSATPEYSPEVHELQCTLGSDALLVEMDETTTAAQVEDVVVQLVTQLEALGVDTHMHLQVLSPVKGTGRAANSRCSVSSFNARLQPIMNQAGNDRTDGKPASFGRFHLYDRVIQLRNDYDKDVYNGDVGMVSQVSKLSLTVHFAARPGSTSGFHEVVYTSQDLHELQPAWCTTVHKSQGAEYPCVVVALNHDNGTPLHTRQLLYTAVTRARQLLILVCTRRALQRCLRTDECQGGVQAAVLAHRIGAAVKQRQQTPTGGDSAALLPGGSINTDRLSGSSSGRPAGASAGASRSLNELDVFVKFSGQARTDGGAGAARSSADSSGAKPYAWNPRASRLMRRGLQDPAAPRRMLSSGAGARSPDAGSGSKDTAPSEGS